jgi:hypothetical protein
MFWDLYQHSQIRSNSQHADKALRAAERTAKQTESMHEKLESKIESLALTCQAMFEMLEARGGFTKEMLAEKMEEIDLRDGKLDGRMSPPKKSCVRCGRRTLKTRSNCLYCGGDCEPE